MLKKLYYTFPGIMLFLVSAGQTLANEGTSGTLDPCDGEDSNNILRAACQGSDQSIGAIIGFVITIAFVIAILIALFFLIWGGIKWITSGGDKGGVEAARNQIVAAVIGLIIVFLAFFILNLVLTLFGLSLFNLQLPTFGGQDVAPNDP